MHLIIDFFLNLVSGLGYWGVFFLMMIESSFIPFPSEIVIPPAAFLASKGEMSVFLIVLFGVLGSVSGALINYFLALTLGRKVVYGLVRSRFAKFFLIDEFKLKKAEEYFLKNGVKSTFIGRLIPVIRQLISVPAGFVKMNLFEFIFYTFLGSFIWVSILALLGYFAIDSVNYFIHYYNVFFVFVFILFLFVLFIFLFNKKRSKICKEF